MKQTTPGRCCSHNTEWQKSITRSEQLPCARVTAFSRTSLFLERFWREFWISFKFHKPVSKTYRPKNDIFCLLIACTQTLLYFSFQKHRRAHERRRRARTSVEREKEKYTPLRWRSINLLRFIFYHPRSTYFEEKIEGLWTGYLLITFRFPFYTSNALKDMVEILFSRGKVP